MKDTPSIRLYLLLYIILLPVHAIITHLLSEILLNNPLLDPDVIFMKGRFSLKPNISSKK